ncbi:cupin domain-containing protein [Actinomadura hibisca]|uniref:cupin domain-containing protein n=1 Tax=Actinomadura hibisca TaxID=68565 RepID=UPI0008306D92|nr:cupin domain-containing protein [Actinomadura hibisca]
MTALITPDEAERLRAPAGEYLVRLSGEHTGGSLAIVEYTFPPGALGAAPHVHHGHEEHFQILDGEIAFDLADGVRTVGAGGTVSVPRGVAHGFRNASSGWARCLFILTPAGYENYFREIHRALEKGEELDAARLTELRAAYNTTPA